jgi:hypothetical protein
VAVSQAEAMAAATADPSVCEGVWRNASRQIFVGLRVDLAKVYARHLQELAEDAWRNKITQAPASSGSGTSPASLFYRRHDIERRSG